MKLLLSAFLACASIVGPTAATAGGSALERQQARVESSADARNPRALKGWKRYEGSSYIAWVPNRNWQIVDAAQCCIDITSPIGDASASVGFADGFPRALSNEEAFGLVMSETANLRILDQGAPFARNGASRQVTEYTGVKEGRQVRGVATIDVYANAAGYALAGYVKFADIDVWNKSKRTLQLILDHVKYLGRNANDPYR